MSVDPRVSDQSDEVLQQADAERYGKLMRAIAWLNKLGGRQVTGKFMLGWFVGRTLRRNALRDVDTAQNVMTPDARLAVARHVIAQMVLIERQRDAANGAIDLHKAVLRQATANRRAVGRYKARRSDPARMAASLVESWVGARLAATQRKISIRAFDRIDAVIWQFIADTIDPAEIQALLGAQ